MGDVSEIIDYIKSLKKRFDKDLFQSKIEELNYIVESFGLNYSDFHTLFRVWLHLTIPIPKWVFLGTCIVPQEKVKQKTVNYCLQWLLANFDIPNNIKKISFLLEWLTAAMETDSIDMNALDIGYEVFYTLLTYEALTPYVLKLIYTLTKPADVTRTRVLELIDLAKKREGKKNMLKQIQVLLGLFKSYKPQCVPEAVPSISIHTTFKKVNTKLLSMFKNSQIQRSSKSNEANQLCWTSQLNLITKNKKVDPLIPSLAFLNIGSQQYDSSKRKNYLDFFDPVSLLQYNSQHIMSRPSRLRALLSNPTGFTLLVVASEADHAFLSYDLQHVLTNCFLEYSRYSYEEKRAFLHHLAILQATFMQGLPVITMFLAQFLPFWNEKDFFGEILMLMEWVNAGALEHVLVIVERAAAVFQRAPPLQQRAILTTLTNMYTNLVYASTRTRQYFLDVHVSEDAFDDILRLVAARISHMCEKGLQATPESTCLVYSVVHASVRRARAEAQAKRGASCVPRALSLAAPLLGTSAAALDALAALLLLYKDIFTRQNARFKKDPQYYKQKKILRGFSLDFVSCVHEEILNERNGIVFSKLRPQTVARLMDLMPDVNSQLSIRNHLALAPYTYVKVQGVDLKDMEDDTEIAVKNKYWLNAFIQGEFDALSQFITQAL